MWIDLQLIGAMGANHFMLGFLCGMFFIIYMMFGRWK